MADRKPAAEAAPAPDAEQLLTILARVTGNLIVKSSTGRDSATFRRIAVQELRIASDADVDAIEAWVTAHPPAR
jgi:hypothetical protein